MNTKKQVTPCMGVWIETIRWQPQFLPPAVTPCMGVWIETLPLPESPGAKVRHTLYGCVD
mgnify:CR=1 FL=1